MGFGSTQSTNTTQNTNQNQNYTGQQAQAQTQNQTQNQTGAQTGQQQNVTQLTPQQQQYQNTALQLAAQTLGNTAPTYSGALTAPLTQTQATSIGDIAGTGQGAGAGAQSQGLDTLGQFASGAFVNDPNLANLLNSTAQYAESQFGQQIPTMQSPFQAAGQYGPSTPEAQYLAQQGSNFQLGLQNQLANQAESSYQQGISNQLNAANQAASQGGAAQAAGLGAAGLQQQTNQQALTNAYQQYLNQLQSGNAFGGLAQTPLGTASASSSQDQATNSLMNQIASAMSVLGSQQAQGTSTGNSTTYNSGSPWDIITQLF